MQEFRKWNDMLTEQALLDEGTLTEAYGYYHINANNPPPIEALLYRWVKDGEKLFDEEIHAYYSVSDLLPWREFVRSRNNTNLSPEQYDSSKEDIAENGIRNPLQILLGRNGKAKIGEGNHRLAIALELNLKQKIPVVFYFYMKVEKDEQNLREMRIEKMHDKIRLMEAAYSDETIRKIMQVIVRAGGKPYIIGGSVRDEIIYKTRDASKDVDFVVCGLPLEKIAEILSHMGKVNLVGKVFGVVKATIDGEEYDFAIPRTKEVKVGPGHGDFKVILDPYAPIEEDLSRRDFTINALAKDPSGKIIDAFGGIKDLENGIIRAVGDPRERFSEDPLRILRAVQFAARFNFTIERQTFQAMIETRSSLRQISAERILEEFYKAWSKGATNSKYLNELLEKLGIGKLLFGVDFSPMTWNFKKNNNNVTTAFVASFLNGGKAEILKPPVELMALLTLARIVKERGAENLHSVRGIRRIHLQQVQEVFYQIENLELNQLAEKLEKVMTLPLVPTELDIGGEQLLSSGLRGPDVGQAQQRILKAIHAGQIQNDYREILDFLFPSK